MRSAHLSLRCASRHPPQCTGFFCPVRRRRCGGWVPARPIARVHRARPLTHTARCCSRPAAPTDPAHRQPCARAGGGRQRPRAGVPAAAGQPAHPCRVGGGGRRGVRGRQRVPCRRYRAGAGGRPLLGRRRRRYFQHPAVHRGPWRRVPCAVGRSRRPVEACTVMCAAYVPCCLLAAPPPRATPTPPTQRSPAPACGCARWCPAVLRVQASGGAAPAVPGAGAAPRPRLRPRPRAPTCSRSARC